MLFQMLMLMLVLMMLMMLMMLPGHFGRSACAWFELATLLG